jgi:hypothetical protein
MPTRQKKYPKKGEKTMYTVYFWYKKEKLPKNLTIFAQLLDLFEDFRCFFRKQKMV